MCRPNYGHSLDTVIICIIDCLCCLKMVWSCIVDIVLYTCTWIDFVAQTIVHGIIVHQNIVFRKKVAISFKITQKDNASCKTDKNAHNKTSCLRSYVSTHFIQCSLLFCLYFSTIARLDWQNHSNERFYGCKQAK